MRKLLTALLLIPSALVFSEYQAKTVEKRYYENKQLESEISYENGKKNGTAVVYSQNGLIRVRGNYRDDRRHGLWTFYFEETSTLQAVEFYENDRLQGKQSYYYPNGRLRHTAVYENDEKKGIWEWFTEEGILEARIEYKSDYRGLAAFYRKGILACHGAIVNEYRSGIWKFYDEKGLPLYSLTYRRGIPFGNYETYNKDGSVLFSGIVDEEGNITVETDGKTEIIDTFTGRF